MIKNSLEIEQIILGALLLNFDNISSVDIYLLTEDFFRKNPGYEFNTTNSEYINKYIKSKNGKISLRDGLNMNSYISENNSNLRTSLEQVADARIIKYLKTFDMEEFLLRKIKYYSGIPENIFNSVLCEKHQEELKKLDDKGYLTTYWEEDSIYYDYKVTTLSDYGCLKLFKIDNYKEIEIFIEELKSLRYDTSLLDDFLLKQDLELPVWNVLNIENLEQFCNDYDRAITEPVSLNVHFKTLKIKKL